MSYLDEELVVEVLALGGCLVVLLEATAFDQIDTLYSIKYKNSTGEKLHVCTLAHLRSLV